MAGICGLDNMDNLTTYSIGTEVRYFYQPCVFSDKEASDTATNCRLCFTNSSRTLSCAQFCDKFEVILPYVYFSVSVLSALIVLPGSFYDLLQLSSTATIWLLLQGLSLQVNCAVSFCMSFISLSVREL